MMSKIGFSIGPAARKCLRITSPYSTLLLDVTRGMSEEDVSQFKLVLQTEKLGTKRQICNLKHSADVMAFLDHHGYISKTCTDFLEHLLLKIDRKDLMKLIEKYNEKRRNKYLNGESTVKKEVIQQYTKLRELKPGSIDRMPQQTTEQTAVKEVYWDSHRSNPDGASGCSTLKASTVSAPSLENTDPASLCFHDSTRDSLDSSPMAIDNSQDSLKSSISDEEKIELLSEKVWKLCQDDSVNDIVMSSQ